MKVGHNQLTTWKNMRGSRRASCLFSLWRCRPAGALASVWVSVWLSPASGSCQRDRKYTERSRRREASSLCMGDLDIIFINADLLDCFGWFGWLGGFFHSSFICSIRFLSKTSVPSVQENVFPLAEVGQVLSLLLKSYSLEKPFVCHDVGCEFTVCKAGGSDQWFKSQ